MTWFLRGTTRADPDAPQPEALDTPLPSGAEQIRKSFVLERIKTDPAIRQSIIGRDVFNEMVDAFGGRAALDEAGIRNYRPRVKPGVFSDSFDYAPVAALTDRIQQLRAFDPARFGSLPATVGEFEAEIQRRDKAEEDEIRSLLDRGDSGLAQFAGGMAGAMADPANIALAFLSGGTGAGARGALTFAAREAALGAVGEVSSIAGQQSRAERLGSPAPDPLSQMAMGAAGGFVLGGAIGGAANYLQYRRARKAAEADQRPEGASGLDHEAAGDTVETALRSGAEPPAIPPPTLTDDEILRRIIGVESGGRATAQNPNSTARGLGQFIESTWLQMIERHRPDLAEGRDRAAILALRDDPQLNAEMTGRLLQDNRNALASAGVSTYPGSLYLAHFMGSGGAVRALRAAPETPIQSLMTADAIRANAGIRHNGKSFAQFTAADLRAWSSAKMGSAPGAGYAGGDGSSSAPVATFHPSQLRRGQTAADEVASPGGLRARVEYRVVDLADLRQAEGALQNRDRAGRAASDEQVADIAARLDPAQLMPGPFGDRGAPVVGPDGVIESGNGRVRALARAAETNPEAFGGYVEQIRAAGFEVPEGMQRPVLIAQRTDDWTPDQRRAWVIDNNSAASARMSSAEQAMTDADYLTAPVMDAWVPGARLGSQQNAEFARRFLGQLPMGERGTFYNKDGSLSVDGLLRLRRALLGRAFGADDIVRLAVESENRAVEGLLRMLEDVAPDWAALRSLTDQGYVRPEFDITDDLMVVVRAIATARLADRDGQSVISAVRDALGQGDMFAAGARDPALSDALLGVFYKGDRARAPDASADILRRYAAEAMQRGRPDSPDMLDGTPPTPAEALEAAAQGHDGRKAFSMPARPAAEAVTVPDTQSIDPAPLADGTASPAVARADDALAADLREGMAAQAEGPFGPMFRDIVDDPASAIARLMAAKAGEVPRAITRPDLGDIAFVYGNRSFGLRHIAEKHPEIMDRLPDILANGGLAGRLADRAYIQLPGDPAPSAVIRLDWDGQDRTWLVTAFDDDQGQIARQLRTSNEPAASASSRIPDATGQGKDSIPAAADQGGDALSRAIDAARLDEPQASTGMRALDDTPIPLTDGDGAATITARDLLADLDADEGLIASMRVCHLGGTA